METETKDRQDAAAPDTKRIVIEQEPRQAQAVYCKCGSLVAACMAPHCYEDSEWQKDVRKFSKDGYKIKMVDPEEVRLTLDSCKCKPNQAALAL